MEGGERPVAGEPDLLGAIEPAGVFFKQVDRFEGDLVGLFQGVAVDESLGAQAQALDHRIAGSRLGGHLERFVQLADSLGRRPLVELEARAGQEDLETLAAAAAIRRRRPCSLESPGRRLALPLVDEDGRQAALVDRQRGEIFDLLGDFDGLLQQRHGFFVFSYAHPHRPEIAQVGADALAMGELSPDLQSLADEVEGALQPPHLGIYQPQVYEVAGLGAAQADPAKGLQRVLEVFFGRLQLAAVEAYESYVRFQGARSLVVAKLPPDRQRALHLRESLIVDALEVVS